MSSRYSILRPSRRDLFHVTYVSRLPSIARHGLRPGAVRSIGGSAYDFHAAKGVFLTEGDGVRYWMSRAEDFAEHNSDNVLEDGLIPVVLSVSLLEEDPKLIPDEIGTNDASANAFIYTGAIPKHRLGVYDGNEWLDISEWGDIDPEKAIDTQIEEDEFDEDGDPVKLHYFKSESPFLPEDLT